MVKQALDRGPAELKTRLSEDEGRIGAIGNREVVTVPPSMTIMGAAKTMARYGFRRIPVADPGTGRLEGILTSFDIVDFCGGGERYLLVEERHGGNLLSAVNESVSEIMNDVFAVGEDSSLKDVLAEMFARNIGGVPVVDQGGRVKAIVTERDFVWLLSEAYIPSPVEEYMTENVISANPGRTIREAAVTMVGNGFRRLPIVRDGLLIGMVTSTDVVRYLGSGRALKRLVTGDSEESFGLPVTEIMSGEVVTVERSTPLGDAVNLMTERGIGSLPVLGDEGLRGIITERDFLRALTGE
ncbi:MAG: hypothetical protein MAG715_00377 [Methanonatronarchaeales archaeon]|nr:hypothetical protein [Methanonatronarchaeales archaeon]